MSAKFVCAAAAIVALFATPALGQSTTPSTNPAANPQTSSTPPTSVAPPVRGGGVTVNETVERPKPPDGDPRSTAERRVDHAAYEKCMLRMQDRSEESFSRAGIADDPRAYCSQKLGMHNADAVPDSVRQRNP